MKMWQKAHAWLLLLGMAVMLVPGKLMAQKFTGKGGTIPDDGQIGIFPLKVSGLPNTIERSFGLMKVCIDAKHTWDGDLCFYLVSPDGSVAVLSTKNGEGEDNYTGCCLSHDTDVSVREGAAPFKGTYRPEISMGGLNNGQNPNGLWKLVVVDVHPHEESGTLQSWSITFGQSPALPAPFLPTNLPLLVLQSEGMPILDEPKCRLRLTIFDGGGKPIQLTDNPVYSGFVSMEVRGRSSQQHPKLSFAMELMDSSGTRGQAASILGLPRERDFVLLANHSDKSLMRNHLAYALFREMGHYASRTKFVDLVIDGEYRGTYLLCEKIKRDRERVNIPRMDKDDNAGDSLTGGYIIKTDWDEGANIGGWESQFVPVGGADPQMFQYHYPEPDDITEAQGAYIKAFMDSFEVAIDTGWADNTRGYPHFIDVRSFVDVMIMVELGKNVDGYWLSSYYHKDRLSAGGKLHAGPIWDYDLAFGNFEFYQGHDPAGWHWQTYSETSEHIPVFWNFLAQDPAFQCALSRRWLELRGSTLSLSHIYGIIDQASAEIQASQEQNFALWPILGEYVWPNPKPYHKTYAREVAGIKDWILMRIAWLDAHMPKPCD